MVDFHNTATRDRNKIGIFCCRYLVFFSFLKKKRGIYYFLISTTNLGRISNIESGTIPSLEKDMQALANWCFKTTKCFEKDFATSLQSQYRE